MTRKSVLYALAVVVLMGTMAVAALADDHEMNAYGPADSSVSAQPQEDVYSSDAGEIREPMETGALPDGSVTKEDGGYLNMDVVEQNSSPELWGRHNIQAGE